MSNDVIWIVTDEVVEAEVGGRDAKSKGNPYDYVDSQPVKALRPQGHCVGAHIGAKAETDVKSSGCLSASVNAPCPPIE